MVNGYYKAWVDGLSEMEENICYALYRFEAELMVA